MIDSRVVLGVTLFVAAGIATSGSTPPPSACPGSAIREMDKVLIGELYHLQDQIGHRIWSGWSASGAPLLYKAPGCEFLINHPAPPEGFEGSSDQWAGQRYWYRSNTDTASYRAAYPINGVFTAVVSAPENHTSVHKWVLESTHEFFHLYQHGRSINRVVDPFVGIHAADNELSYPFPYGNEVLRSLMRIEAEEVFRATREYAADSLDVRMAGRVLGHIQAVAAHVFEDSLDLRYKRWLEWYEGVARYTERELAALAAQSGAYMPSTAFARQYGGQGYAEVWEREYANSLNPIRFVGEGVQGRVQFYYLGMGKAYLLDRLQPDWQDRYFSAHLDSLLHRRSSPDG